MGVTSYTPTGRSSGPGRSQQEHGAGRAALGALTAARLFGWPPAPCLSHCTRCTGVQCVLSSRCCLPVLSCGVEAHVCMCLMVDVLRDFSAHMCDCSG